jgi:hypothetical protein
MSANKLPPDSLSPLPLSYRPTPPELAPNPASGPSLKFHHLGLEVFVASITGNPENYGMLREVRHLTVCEINTCVRRVKGRPPRSRKAKRR